MEIWITIKNKETSGKLTLYITMKLLTTHSTGHTGYYLCVHANTIPAR